MTGRRIIFNIEDKEQYFALEDSYILQGANGLDNEQCEKVNKFFKASKYLSILMDQTNCLISNENIDHYETLMTDGTWIWSADINHYLLNHCIEIPDVFLKYILDKKSYEVISDKKLVELTNWFFDRFDDSKSNFVPSRKWTILK